MSNHTNHRRGEEYRSEHGPRWESHDPGAGCNSTHVAKGRKKWKKFKNKLTRLYNKILTRQELEE